MGKNILTRELLLRSVKEWNEAREENPDLTPDLGGADLNKVYLFGANLERADLSGANLQKAHLDAANLRGVNFQKADLREAKFFRADLRYADLSGANLQKACFNEANLHRLSFQKADLCKASFNRADLRYANFSAANLSAANLCGANLSRADLSGAYCYITVFRDANLIFSNLSNAYLNWSSFVNANLSYSNLNGATLNRAKLIGVDLTGAYLSKTTLTETFVGSTSFGSVDLSSVIGLDTIRHTSPSTIGIDTIYLSNGEIPEVFLRGCGVPDAFIKSIRELKPKASDYYSCFISHSSLDTIFVDRLYDELQEKGVRCYYAPHDLPIGAKTRPTLHEEIRNHDKLLLVLSEHSVKSSWVEDEVEHAFELEKERGMPVLFPIRLDDAVMVSKTGWASSVRTQRNIGDFTKWKDHDAYQEAFTRLLRDLKQ